MIRRLFGLIPLLHLYIGLRLLPDLFLGEVVWLLGIVALIVSTILIPMAMLSRRMPERRRADKIAWAGFLAMGWFSSILVLTLMRDAALLLAATLIWLIDIDLALQSAMTWSARGVPLIATLLSIVGFFAARRRAAVKAVDVPITGLPPALRGFTIAQITDVHVGPTVKRDYLNAIVLATNALGADLIAITGDMVDGGVGELTDHIAPLANLRARHGVYCVTGNHEYYSGVHAWVAEFRRLGLTVLMNQHVVIDCRRGDESAQLIVAGVTDFHAEHYDSAHKSDPELALVGVPENAAMKMLLAHQPRSGFAAAQAGFDLQLSGHTHGGQFAPWMFFVRLQQPFTSGLHRLDRMWVYVSRGAGYWGPPLRIGAPSEISLLRLVLA
ncbi:MAG: metallophosphoesterase [Burkholderiales bacterium]